MLMLHRIKQLIREFFGLSKAEQYGIVVLTVLILLFSVIYFILPLLISGNRYNNPAVIEKVKRFEQQQQIVSDSVRIEKIQSTGQLNREMARNKIHPFVFDPNKLPARLWKKMGLTDKQIKVIKNYEAKGGKFYQKEDLKNIYCISPAEYKILEPYIQIKTVFTPKGADIIKTSFRNKPSYRYTELNGADTTALHSNLNLPLWLCSRITAYRKKLGGFYTKEQLKEVYGFKTYYYSKIAPYVTVDTLMMHKICVNQTGFKQLLKHPYCDYNLTKKIFSARDKAGGEFTNRSQLLKIIGNDTTGLKLLHYLYLCRADIRDN